MKRKETISDIAVAYNGALLAIAAVFIYSILVMIYIIIRSSVTIYSSMPMEERNSILFASGFSVAYSVITFSLLMAIFSSVIGFVAAIVLKNTLLYFNPLCDFRKAFLISCMTALSITTFIYLLLKFFLKDWMTYTYIEPIFFWFIFPAILFSIVCIISGMQLNKLFRKCIIELNKKSTEITN